MNNRINGLKLGGAICASLLMGLIIITSLSNCSSCSKGEEAQADIIAAQMEGRNAAREFITRPWSDTAELHFKLLEARAKRAKYDTTGRKHCAEAFDSAFISTIRTVDPGVAKAIEK